MLSAIRFLRGFQKYVYAKGKEMNDIQYVPNCDCDVDLQLRVSGGSLVSLRSSETDRQNDKKCSLSENNFIPWQAVTQDLPNTSNL